MIATFKSRPLAELFRTGGSPRIDPRLHARIVRRLDALNEATTPKDMDLPGFNFHAVRGFDPTRYTVHVNGPWRLTFSFIEGEAREVDFEQYH